MSAMKQLPDYIQAAMRGDTKPLGQTRWGTTRADLLVIPDAEAAGWRVRFRRGLLQTAWHDPASFQRNWEHVWYCSLGWRHAFLEHGRFTGHTTHATVGAALGLDPKDQAAATERRIRGALRYTEQEDGVLKRTFDFGTVELSPSSEGKWLFRCLDAAPTDRYSAIGYHTPDDAYAAAHRIVGAPWDYEATSLTP